jgi:hypothetical protein
MNLASDIPYPSLGSASLPVVSGGQSVDQYVNGTQASGSSGGGTGNQFIDDVEKALEFVATNSIGFAFGGVEIVGPEDEPDVVSPETTTTPDDVTPQPNENGYFGVKGQSSSSSVRNMPGGNTTAQDFFDNITNGYINEENIAGGGIVRTMPDGTNITYRPSSSSDGTPAVDINHGSTYIPQKIHFVE